MSLAFWAMMAPPGALGAAPYQRVVSLAPTITKEIYLLGAQNRLVANTTYCVKPPEAARKEKAGNVVEANVEKIVALRADLVLATVLVRRQDVRRLRGLGIPVEVFPYPRSFAELCQQFLRVGELMGEEAKARELIARAEADVAALRARTATLPKKRVFMQIGSQPLFTVSRESFVNDYITWAGGINVAAGAGAGIFSREQVLEADPEVIIITTMGVAGERERRTWMRYPSLAAAKKGAIHILDPEDVCGPTPLSFAETLRTIARLIHPDLGKEARPP